MTEDRGGFGQRQRGRQGRTWGFRTGEAVPVGLGGSHNQHHIPRRALTVQAEM